MRKKQYVIAKGLPGQEILKSRAMSGEDVYGWHFMTPSQLASEIRQSYGICLERPVLSQAEAVFLLYELLQNSEKVQPYFTARSIADVQTAMTSIQRLRMQLPAEEPEGEGLRRLLSTGEEGGVIPQKNEAMLEELALPYLKALEDRGLEDAVTVLRRTVCEGKNHELPLLDGTGWMVEERPLAPLERQLVFLAFGLVNIEKEEELLSRGCGAEGSVRKFNAYGASNEVRRIVEEIRADGKPLDQYLVACADPAKYEPLFCEYEGLSFTGDSGRRASGARVCLVAEKILQWHRNAYTRKSFQGLADELDSAWLRRKMMEDGIEEKETYRLWNTVLSMAKQLYFSLDPEENLRRLAALETILDGGEEANAKEKKKAMPYGRIFARSMTVRTILETMVWRRDTDGFEPRSHSVFLELLDAALRWNPKAEIEVLPAVIQLFSEQRIGGGSPETGKVYLCRWDKAHLYRRPIVYLCGLQSLTGSLSENAFLLDGDIRAIRTVTPQSDLRTTTEQIQKRSEDLRRIVAYLKESGTRLTLSWSDYSLSELKALSVPAVLWEIEGDMEKRAGFVLEKMDDDDSDGSDTAVSSRGLGTLPLLTVTPSSAEKMLKCPYSFVLTKILGIREPEDEDSQTIWLNAAEKGTFCHSVFEKYVRWERSEETRERFKTMDAETIQQEKKARMEELGERYLAEWRIRKPYRGNEERSRRELSTILDGFLRLWETIPEGSVEMTETKIEDRPIVDGKLQCHGIPDLVMDLDQQGISVLDYKTGKDVKHKENDTVTCVQTLLYCMMLNQKEYGDRKLSTRYLYPLAEKSVGCRFDDSVKTTVVGLFQNAISAMETGTDWLATDHETGAKATPAGNPTCSWCKLREFCTRDTDVSQRLFENEEEKEEENSDDDR